MKLYSGNEHYKLYQGNMLDMLEIIEPNSIDSIVTDPPYDVKINHDGGKLYKNKSMNQHMKLRNKILVKIIL